MKGDRAAVELLLDYKADVNFQANLGFTPLAMAVTVITAMGRDSNTMKFIVRLLLQRGADADLQDMEGKTPLELAEKAEKDEQHEVAQVIKDHIIMRLRRAEMLIFLLAQHLRLGGKSPASLLPGDGSINKAIFGFLAQS